MTPGEGASSGGRLRIVLVITAAYMLAEIVGGLLSNSLALLSDAGHMLSDVAALLIAMLGIRIGNMNAGPQHTYGYYRAEIFAALLNGIFLVLVAVWIVYEGYQRLVSPPEVRGGLMLLVAAGGLVVNLAGIALLHEARASSLNIRAAFAHIVGDLLGSLGAVLAGGLILWKGWRLADPLISFFIAALIIFSSWKILQEAINVFMEGPPAHINVASVSKAIQEITGVLSMHDLHIWTITSGKEALSAHVVRDEDVSPKLILQSLQTVLEERFAISHLTIQIETEDFHEDEIHF